MLNDNKRRAVSVTFRIVEQYLHAIGQMLTAKDYNGILMDWENNVSISHREILAAKISESIEVIRTASEQFFLEKTRKEARQQISNNLSYCWEMLQGVKAKKLNGYGEINSILENILDPQIDQLITILDQMQSLLQSEKEESRER